MVALVVEQEDDDDDGSDISERLAQQETMDGHELVDELELVLFDHS